MAVLFNLLALCLTVNNVSSGVFFKENPIVAFALVFSPLFVFSLAYTMYALLAVLKLWLDKFNSVFASFLLPNAVLTIWSADLCWDLLLVFGSEYL